MSGQYRRSRSLTIWLVLVVLVAVAVVADQTGVMDPDGDVDEHGEAAYRAKFLLPVPLEQVHAVELGDVGSVHRLERDDAGVWSYHGRIGSTEIEEPHAAEADPAHSDLIEAAIAAFSRTRIQREVGAGLDGETYGVADPGMIIKLFEAGNDQPVAHYIVGDLEPDELRRYLLITDQDLIVTIPNYQIDNLRGLVATVRAESQ